MVKKVYETNVDYGLSAVGRPEFDNLCKYLHAYFMSWDKPEYEGKLIYEIANDILDLVGVVPEQMEIELPEWYDEE